MPKFLALPSILLFTGFDVLIICAAEGPDLDAAGFGKRWSDHEEQGHEPMANDYGCGHLGDISPRGRLGG